MPNQENLEKKMTLAKEVQEKIQGSAGVVVVDYLGYTVEQVTELRSKMRAEDVDFKVYKNTIVERAAKEVGVGEEFIALLKGPSAFAFSDDSIAPARIIKDFIKQTKMGAIKGGIIDGNFSDVTALEAIAGLPSRDVLISRILGSINSPIVKIAIAINMIKEKMESGVDISQLSAAGNEESAEAEAQEAAVVDETTVVEEETVADTAPEPEAAAEESSEDSE